MSDITSVPIVKGVDFVHINRDNFNRRKVSVCIFLPLGKEVAFRNAILPRLLSRKCEKFSDFTSFNRKLSDLYGMDISCFVGKIGDIQVLEISADFLEDRFALFGERISKDAIGLLCEVLFRPYITDDGFDSEDFEQEKRQLLELIESEYSDKRLYAYNQTLNVMFSDAYAVNQYGTKEDAEKFDRFDAYNDFKKILKRAKIKIVSVGSDHGSKIASLFKEEFSKIKRGEILECESLVTSEVKKQKSKIERQEIKQAKLVMGFRSSISYVSEDFFSAILMCSIFGGSSHSKLFLNVREKKGLCYYCYCGYDKDKGVMFVQSGVKEKDIEEAKEEILKQLEEIKNGNVSEEEISSAKLSLKNAFMSSYDSVSNLVSFFVKQFLLPKEYTPEEFTLKIDEVTRDEIIKAAKTFKIDTTFSLVPNA